MEGPDLCEKSPFEEIAGKYLSIQTIDDDGLRHAPTTL